MATINFATREIIAKIVYFGASGAGSNTNVQRLYELVDGQQKSKLHKFGPGGTTERSWYFQYVPGGTQEVNGFRVAYRIYSLPGGLDLPAHREEVIGATDALIFVSDARPECNRTNLDSMLGLEQLLAQVGMQLATLPVVLQVNHMDHKDARPPEDVAYDLNPYGWPVEAACAVDGTGVLATHEEVTEALTGRIRQNLGGSEAAISLTAVHQPERESDHEVIQGHIDKITALSPSTPPELIDEHTGTPADLEALPPAEVSIPFKPPGLPGTVPTEVLSAHIEGDRVVVELLLQGEPSRPSQKLTVLLENRPTETPPTPRRQKAEAQTAPPAEGRVFDYLPETVDFNSPAPPPDFPGMWYGVLGTAAGVVIGLLLGYLVGVVI